MLVGLMLGCGPGVGSTGGSSTGTTAIASSTTTTEGTGATTQAGSSTAVDGSTTTGGGTSESSSGSTDTGIEFGEDCDILAQDCAEGLKCTVVGGLPDSPQWHCVPVAEAPVGVNEPCTVEEFDSGLDDCDVGAVCWDVDSRTLEGSCVEYCTGEWPEPTCDDPDAVCNIPGDASYGMWCFEVCDPRQLRECPPGEICAELSFSFTCASVAVSGGSAVAESCDHTWACDPGLACIDLSEVPGCQGGGFGCCSSFCTIGDDTPCLPGQQCVPWFDDEVPHPSFEDLGVCRV